MRQNQSRSGFTLVELAIVLVIIGLIIGGVLVGQDLIKAATIRATVSEFEKLNAAVNTFRGKYNGLPGDLINTRATDFSLNTTNTDGNRDGTAGKGDGNGIIEACAAGANGFGCETALFWTDLSAASLLTQKFTGYTSTTAAVALSTLNLYAPKSKLRDAALITVFNNNGRNYFALGASSNAAIAAVATAGAITYTAGAAGAAVAPLEARNIDEKIDDGAALTGTVVSFASGTNPTTLDTAVATAANRCVLTGGSYMVDTDAHSTNMACAISIRTSF